jgi:ribose-phosphate pyrophosphokinase
MADLITTAGATRVVSVDLHAAQIQGFFNVPVDHLFAIPTLARAWRDRYGSGDDFVAVSPDAGGVERTRAFAKRIDCSLAIIDKRRSGPNEAKALHLIGDVAGKNAIIVDDMIDTGGTLTQAVDSLYKNGAKKVFAVASHPVLSGPAVSRLIESPIEQVWVTDTIPLSEQAKTCKKIEVISMATVLAEAIKRIHGKDSVSSLFDL